MASRTATVGVLAIQGDVEKHLAALERLGARGRRVLVRRDLEGADALILPGGESTTIAKGLDRLDLAKPIQEFAEAGGAILGTCAGAILLSRSARNHPVPTLGLLDEVMETSVIQIEGRQRHQTSGSSKSRVKTRRPGMAAWRMRYFSEMSSRLASSGFWAASRLKMSMRGSHCSMALRT